jgi:hypothetical protein
VRLTCAANALSSLKDGVDEEVAPLELSLAAWESYEYGVLYLAYRRQA